MSRTIDQQRGDPNEPGAGTGPDSGGGANVIVTAEADRDMVQDWLEKRGLRAVPMQAGFQVVGPRALLESALGAMDGASVPSELAGHVEKIQPTERKYLHV